MEEDRGEIRAKITDLFLFTKKIITTENEI